MKYLLKVLVPGLLLLGMLTGSAWAQNRVATIDLRKVFDGYWKTRQADASLKERAADMDKEFKNMRDDFQKAKDDYEKLLTSANDQAVSPDEREKRKKAAEDKLKYLRDQDDTINQYRRQATSTLEEQKRRMRENLLGEIRVLVNGRAKSDGFSMVIDVAADSANLTPVVLFNDNKNDITDEILKQLNAAAPPDALKPEPKKEETAPAGKPEEKKK